MMIQDLLNEFAARHGNDWPKEALERLIQIACQGGDEGDPEYDVLHQWALDTIEAGVAFRQTRDAC